MDIWLDQLKQVEFLKENIGMDHEYTSLIVPCAKGLRR
jgi:hypothetical protein